MSVISNEDTEYAVLYADSEQPCSICGEPLSYPFVAWMTRGGLPIIQICGECCGGIKDGLTADLNLTASIVELREQEAKARIVKRNRERAAEGARYRHTIIRLKHDLPYLCVEMEDGNRVARKIITEIGRWYGQCRAPTRNGA
jgi:hypothetical protein